MSLKYLPEHAQAAILESLFAAQQACNMLFAVIEKAEAELHRLGVPKIGPFV